MCCYAITIKRLKYIYFTFTLLYTFKKSNFVVFRYIGFGYVAWVEILHVCQLLI
jgi:hypothetical protein